jgi:hypothetical protein
MSIDVSLLPLTVSLDPLRIIGEVATLRSNLDDVFASITTNLLSYMRFFSMVFRAAART